MAIPTPNLSGMLFIIQAQAPDRFHILQSERCKQGSDFCFLICYFILSKYVSPYYIGTLRFGNVGDSFWEYGVSVVGSA